MAITISGNTLTFNDGTTQTTAATGSSTTAGAVGTYTLAASTSTLSAGSTYAIGTTVAGSSLILYVTNFGSYAGTMGGLYVYNNYWQSSPREDQGTYISGGYVGTWQLMTRLTLGGGAGFNSNSVVGLYIRIS
jgi:hypothetical protein